MSKIFGILFSFLSATQVQAFTLNSSTDPNLRGWASGDIQLRLNPTNCPASVDVAGIISAAAEIWNNVPTSSIKVSYVGTTTSTTYASPATVYCETNFQSVVHADQDAVPGAASVQTLSGQIVTGLMYLNVSSGNGNIANFDQTTLKIILAHEIGHLLGLGHSESTKALMYYDASAKKNSRLSQDDIDGITYLYPSDEFKDGKYAGCGLITTNLKPPSRGQIYLILFLMMLPLLVYLKFRSMLRKSRAVGPSNI